MKNEKTLMEIVGKVTKIGGTDENVMIECPGSPVPRKLSFLPTKTQLAKFYYGQRVRIAVTEHEDQGGD
jgi:hypothetical protein